MFTQQTNDKIFSFQWMVTYFKNVTFWQNNSHVTQKVSRFQDLSWSHPFKIKLITPNQVTYLWDDVKVFVFQYSVSSFNISSETDRLSWLTLAFDISLENYSLKENFNFVKMNILLARLKQCSISLRWWFILFDLDEIGF